MHTGSSRAWWLRPRYHSPADDVRQRVDLQAAGKYDRLMLAVAESVADNAERPQWKPGSFFRRFAE